MALATKAGRLWILCGIYRYEDFLGQSGVECAKGFVDKSGAVIERHDCHLRNRAVGQDLFGQSRRYLLDFGLYVLDGFERVESVADDRHAADGFCTAFVQGSAPQGRSI